MSLIDYPIENFLANIHNTQTAFPVSNGGFWHNGVHFTGNTAIKNIYDGEIVALRVTDEFENCFVYKNDSILLAVIAGLFGLGGKLNDLRDKNMPKFDQYYDLENNYYKMKQDLTDEQRQDAMNLVGDLFSNNFILIKHEVQNEHGTVICFYSLAMHLKPLKRISNAQKIALYWYESFFELKSPKYNAVPIKECYKKIGNGLKPEWISTIPCETVVTVKEKGKDTSKIEWILNETTYAANIQTKFIRFECFWNDPHEEIKRPVTEADKKGKEEEWKAKYLENGFSQQNGILVYSTADSATRVVRAILETHYQFDIKKSDVLDAYSNKTVFKITYKNTKESIREIQGYIYVSKELTVDEKEDFTDFRNVITGDAETVKSFGDIELRIRLRNGIQKNNIFKPEQIKIKKGEIIGFAGYTLITDRDGEKVVENEDATAIHYEIFCPSIDFLTVNKDKKQRCEYKIAETITAQTGQLGTVPTPKKVTIGDVVLENLSNVYIRKMSSSCLIQGEIFYKVKLLATVTASFDNEYVIRDEAFTPNSWDFETCTWKGKSSASVSLYNSAGTALPEKTVSMYSDLFYPWKAQEDVKVGKKNILLRLPIWWYIKILEEPVVYVSEENFKKFKHIKTDDYILSKVVISGDQLLDEPTQTAWSGASVLLEKETCDHEKKRIDEYQSFTKKTPKHTWQKLKRRSDGSTVWVKVADIKETKDGKPIERIRYNDWNYFFKEIDLSKAGTYKLSSLTAAQFEKIGLPHDTALSLEQAVQRPLHEVVSGAPKRFGAILSSHITARDFWAKCYYKAKSEWIKDEELTKALYANSPSFKKRTEKLREGFVFWDDTKRLRSPNFPSSDSNYYFHPHSFIEHLNKVATPAEFNPYEEKTLEPRDKKKDDGNIYVTSNPGFAPALLNVSETKFPKELEMGGKYWAALNYPYGYSWAYDNKEKPHLGIDLAGETGTPVYSLIHGEVWATTWKGSVAVNAGDKGSYGHLMIVKATRADRLYLFSHLSGFNKEVDDIVMPGDIVAYVGSTGYSTGPHLHVEVYICDLIRKEKVLDLTQCKKHGEGLGLEWNNEVFKDRVLNRRDPLDHTRR